MAGKVSIQKLQILLEAKGVKLTKSELQGLEDTANNSAASIAGITTAIAAMAASAKLIKDSVQAFKEFEFAISKVEAVSGATTVELNKLTNSAKALGAQTRYTSSEVANLQFEFSKLGFTAPQILNAQEAILNLAMASGAELPDAASKAGETLRMFNLEAHEMGRVVDVMAASFAGSALDIEKLSNSLVYVGPVASTAGISLEGVAGSLGALANRGINASIAGTHLRRILLEMGNENSKLSKAIGFSVKNTDDFLKALDKLSKMGLTNAQAMDFVGKRSVATFQSLLQGVDTVAKLTEEFENASGAGQEMADTMMDNLEGDTIRLQSAWNNLTITIGEQFAPALRDATQAMTFFISNVDEEDLYAYTTGLGIVTLGVVAFKWEVIAATKAMKMLKLALVKSGWGALVVLVGLATGALLDFLGVFDVATDEIEDYETNLDDATESTENFKNSVNNLNTNQISWDLVFDKSAYEKALKDLNFDLTNTLIDLDIAEEDLDNAINNIFEGIKIKPKHGVEFDLDQVKVTGKVDMGPSISSSDAPFEGKNYVEGQIESYDELIRVNKILNGELELNFDNQMFISQIVGYTVDSVDDLSLSVHGVYRGYDQVADVNGDILSLLTREVDVAKSIVHVNNVKLQNTKEEIKNIEDQMGLNDRIKKQIQDKAFSEEAIKNHYIKTLESKEQERAKNAIIVQQRLYEKNLLMDMNQAQLVTIGNLLSQGKTMAEILRMYGDESYAIDTISEKYDEYEKKRNQGYEEEAESMLQRLRYEGELQSFQQSDIDFISQQLQLGREMNTILREQYGIEIELLEMTEEEKLSIIQEFHGKQRELSQGSYQNEMNLINERRDAYIEAGVHQADADRLHAQELRELNLQTAQQFIGGVSAGAQALYETGNMHRKDARNVAIGETVVNTYASATAAYKAMAGIPIVGPALGVIAAAAATAAGLASVERIKAQYMEPAKKPKDAAAYTANFTEYGMSGLVTEPTKIIAGEAGPEQVDITPLTPGKNAFGGGSGPSISVNLSGNILTKDFVEDELAEKIKDALGRGVDFGIN